MSGGGELEITQPHTSAARRLLTGGHDEREALTGFSTEIFNASLKIYRSEVSFIECQELAIKPIKQLQDLQALRRKHSHGSRISVYRTNSE